MCSQFVPQEGKNPRFLTPLETARLQGSSTSQPQQN